MRKLGSAEAAAADRSLNRRNLDVAIQEWARLHKDAVGGGKEDQQSLAKVMRNWMGFIFISWAVSGKKRFEDSATHHTKNRSQKILEKAWYQCQTNGRASGGCFCYDNDRAFKTRSWVTQLIRKLDGLCNYFMYTAIISCVHTPNYVSYVSISDYIQYPALLKSLEKMLIITWKIDLLLISWRNSIFSFWPILNYQVSGFFLLHSEVNTKNCHETKIPSV